MVQRILIVEGIWTFRFYYYLTLLVMAGLCLLLIPDSIIDVVTGALFFTGDWDQTRQDELETLLASALATYSARATRAGARTGDWYGRENEACREI